RYNISQNDARKNGLGAIELYNGGSGISNIEIFNNTIFITTASSTPHAVHIQTATTNVHLRNNILIATGTANLLTVAAGQSGILFQGNDYWANGAPLKIQWGYSTYSDLASWRLSTGQETVNGLPSGMSLDPLLTAAGAGGAINNPDNLNALTAYNLLSASPMIDRALTLSSLFGVAPGTRDFRGMAIFRLLAYDVGASEF